MQTAYIGRGACAAILLTIVLTASPSLAFECATAPEHGVITANPNRPTVSNPADITQLGVLEVESGYTRTWLSGGVRTDDTGTLLKFSALCDLELHWGPDPFTRIGTASDSFSGTGDNFIGAQFRFHHQTQKLPTLSFRYDAKLPTASPSKALGSGEVDHQFTLLASKDLSKSNHFDFNLGELFAGRSSGHAFDSSFNLALAASRALPHGFSFSVEGSGQTKLNRNNESFASLLGALTYKINSRLVLDCGMAAGLSSAAPHKRLFAGLTYSIGELYPRYRN